MTESDAAERESPPTPGEMRADILAVVDVWLDHEASTPALDEAMIPLLAYCWEHPDEAFVAKMRARKQPERTPEPVASVGEVTAEDRRAAAYAHGYSVNDFVAGAWIDDGAPRMYIRAQTIELAHWFAGHRETVTADLHAQLTAAVARAESAERGRTEARMALLKLADDPSTPGAARVMGSVIDMQREVFVRVSAERDAATARAVEAERLLRAIVAGFDRAESLNGLTLLELIRSDHSDGVPSDASEYDIETERVIGAMADAVDRARKRLSTLPGSEESES